MPSVKDFEKKHGHKKHTDKHTEKHSHGKHADKHEHHHAAAKHPHAKAEHAHKEPLTENSDTLESAIDENQNDSTYQAGAKRRPGRDHEAHADSPEVAVVDVHDGVEVSHGADHGADEASASRAEAHGSNGHSNPAEDSWAAPEDKVELNFYGSEILRAKFPKAFDVAETVATEWIHDGNFEGLPLGHPLAQYFAAKGLKKAKEVEKKVMESPVTEKVAMQALQAGMKAQEFISQIREKVQKK